MCWSPDAPCSKQCVYWISVSTHNVNTQRQIFWQDLGAVSQQECLWMDVMNINHLTNPISHHVPEATKIPVKAPNMAPKPYRRQAGLLHFQLLSWVHAHLKLIHITHDEELSRSKSWSSFTPNLHSALIPRFSHWVVAAARISKP